MSIAHRDMPPSSNIAPSSTRVLALDPQQLTDLWNKAVRSRRAQKAFAQLKEHGFAIGDLEPASSKGYLTWADYLASIPFLPNQPSRRQIRSSKELRKYLQVVRILRNLGCSISDPFTEVVIQTDKDIDCREINTLGKRVSEAADFLSEVLQWDWSSRNRNPRNTMIAVLRAQIRFRTGKPHDNELNALIDAVFRAAGKEGMHIEPTTLDRIEKREKEGRVKTARRLHSLGHRRYTVYPR